VTRTYSPTRLLAVAGALAVFLASAAAHPATAQPAPDPASIKISSCVVTKPRPFSHHPTGTEIAFVNAGPTVLHAVTFKVDYRTASENLTRTFEDSGTFAPNEPVKHHYPTYSDVEYAGAKPVSCTVLGVH
jgi:hypothetical protein